MPLSKDLLGTNADGSMNEDYCIYCFDKGVFTFNGTMEEMADHCSQFVSEYNKHSGNNLSREAYRDELCKFYPTLKRWRR